MGDYAMEDAVRRVATALDGISRAIDRNTEVRRESMKQSLGNMSDERLDKLERVIGSLERLQNRE